MTKHDKAEAEIDALITLIGAHSSDYTGSGYSLKTANGWAKLTKKYPAVNVKAAELVNEIYGKHKLKSV
jgi:hypothetical protein